MPPCDVAPVTDVSRPPRRPGAPIRVDAEIVSGATRPPPITPVHTFVAAPATSSSRRAIVGNRDASRGWFSPARFFAHVARSGADPVFPAVPSPRMPELLTPRSDAVPQGLVAELVGGVPGAGLTSTVMSP